MSNLTTEQRDVARQYDLTPKMTQFLDRHLNYPLIENLELIYDPKQVDQWEFDLLKNTYMTKFIEEKWQELHPSEPLPEEIKQQQATVEQKFNDLDGKTQKTLETLSSEDVQKNLKQDKAANREYLARQGVDDAKIYELYEFGKLQYNRGDYGMASDLLNNFRMLSTNKQLNFSATWGKLAAEIITSSWSEAQNEINKLREVIDNRNYEGTPLDQLNKRVWLIHNALFVFLSSGANKNELKQKKAEPAPAPSDEAESAEKAPEAAAEEKSSEAEEEAVSATASAATAAPAAAVAGAAGAAAQGNQGLNTMIDLFLSSSYISAIQAACPWVLRYLVVAVIQTKQHKRLRDIVRAVDVETYEFQDPYTKLLETLFINYDFDSLPEQIAELTTVNQTDYFISNLDPAEFVQNLHELVLTTVTKVYSEVTVADLAKILALEESAVEELLKEKKLEVVDGQVVTAKTQPASVYQQIYEKTKAFNFRSNQILNNAFKTEA